MYRREKEVAEMLAVLVAFTRFHSSTLTSLVVQGNQGFDSGLFRLNEGDKRGEMSRDREKVDNPKWHRNDPLTQYGS